ncbi:MAG: ABC transporter ATP-binding protein/permease [Clostridiales bacterium]|nr:ABC transporter ATP-binding protein/permease [Clostridiales bacterium]
MDNANTEKLKSKASPNNRPGGGPRGIPNGGFKKPKNTGRVVKRILQYIGKSKYWLIVSLLAVLGATAFSVLASARLQPLIDKAIYPVFDKSELIKQLVILASFYILSSIMNFAQSKIMVNIAYKTTNIIRRDLFDHMQTLPIRYFDSKTHGEIMSRFTNDVDNMQVMLEQSVVQLISSVFTFIGIVAMMIYFNWKLFLIVLVFLIIMVRVTAFIGKKTRKHYQAQQKNLGIMNGYIEENIEGMKVVKIFNHENTVTNEFGELNTNFCQSATKANFYSGIMGPCSSGINNTAYAVVTVLGALMVIMTGGTFSVGSLTSFLTYSKQFSQPIQQITNQMNNIFSALAGAERVFEIMDMDSEIDDGTVTAVTKKDENGNDVYYWDDGGKLTKIEGNIIFDGVTFSYVENKVVLKDINLYAKPNQKIAFVGSTGAGKTTITNLINRFYDIQEGTITYDSIDIRRIKKADLRRSMSMVLQDTSLFTGTILDNIRYGRTDATDDECIAAAKLAAAHSFIRRLPNGYNTVITGGGENLSQGQRQLLSIARAAVAKPVVLILDEATSSVDTRTELHIEHGMDRLMEGRTVFVIAHRLSTVRNSNAIMVLEHGEIIERGDHDDLLGAQGRYYELYTGKAKLS